MATTDDDVTFTIEASDGTADSFDVPRSLVDALREGDGPAAGVAGDIAVMAFTGRAHALVHHHDEAHPALEAAEQSMLERFQARFGVSYAEATGHSH